MKNTDPKKLDATNIGDAVVIDDGCGVQRSAILDRIDPQGVATFTWKHGPGPRDITWLSMGGPFLRGRVLAIFPPKSNFLVVERNKSDESPVFLAGEPFVSIS
jgi:hypothetical protein